MEEEYMGGACRKGQLAVRGQAHLAGGGHRPPQPPAWPSSVAANAGGAVAAGAALRLVQVVHLHNLHSSNYRGAAAGFKSRGLSEGEPACRFLQPLHAAG